MEKFYASKPRDMVLDGMYQQAMASFWTPHEIDLAEDKKQWMERLNDNERHFLKHVRAFFAASDLLVNENLAARFMREIDIPEARAFYAFQIAMEQVSATPRGSYCLLCVFNRARMCQILVF